MNFRINKQFAGSYNRYRQLEEFEKLKAKHGDIKLTRSSNNKTKKFVSDVNEDSSYETDNASTDSSSDTDESWLEKEQEDFLNLYKALHNNDPSLDDPNKHWFRDPSVWELQETSDKSISKEGKKKTEIKLRDFQHDFLINHGGLENDKLAKDASCLAKTESEDVLKTLKKCSELSGKQKFLTEVNEAFELVNSKNVNKDIDMSFKKNNELDFLQKRPPTVDGVNESPKCPMKNNVDNLKFIDSGNAEAESFLRDYFLHQRWRSSSTSQQQNQIPSYVQILQQCGVHADDVGSTTGQKKSKTISNYLDDDDILDEDDAFLVKVNNYDKACLNSPNQSSDVCINTCKSQFKFQEKDEQLIKTYPRRIESSVGQSMNPISKRAEKRRARNEMKKRAKNAKLAELERLRQLKLADLVNKIERIKKSCGPVPSATSALDTDILSEYRKQKQQQHSTSEKNITAENVGMTAMDIADYLDKDWDPAEHDKIVNSIFDASYQNDIQDFEKPKFSDDSADEELEADEVIKNKPNKEKTNEIAMKDINDDMEVKSGRRKRRKSMISPDDYPDFEKYIEEYYKLHCEDIITGGKDEKDVHCRFKYRQVKPNDYGLTTDEILNADVKELNRWLPLSRITAYKTDAEEERDYETYHSTRQDRKKYRILPSTSNVNVTRDSNSNSIKENELSKTKKKKRRRKRKKKHVPLEQLTDAIQDLRNSTGDDERHLGNSSENKYDSKNNHISKHPKAVHKLNGITISRSRLQAAGVSSKELYGALKKKKTIVE